MSEIINDIICSIIQVIAFFGFIKSLLEIDRKIINRKNIAIFIILNVVTIAVHRTEYSIIATLIIFISLIFALYAMYQVEISKTFLIAGFFMMTLSLADILTSIVFINFVDIIELREKYFIYANLCVAIITLLLIKIPKLKKFFLKIIETCTEKKNFETIVFIILLICALCIITYIISNNFNLTKTYTLSIMGILIFLILALIFFKEKYEKDTIITKYDQLFEYVNTFEEWMDNESLNIHESRNQLATLRDMVKSNKRAIEYIDNIIKEKINIENDNIKRIKYIPKGGLKGLLYYKITIAENNGLNMFVDVTKESNQFLLKLNTEEMKLLCSLVGIFLDNAIEASKDTSRKALSCEIYVSESALNIVISNSFSGKIELNKITGKGYSTKGKNRGKGLYLARKVIRKNNRFSLNNRIINNYFIQRIIIKKQE